MSIFGRRGSGFGDLERELRAARPRPDDELVSRLADRVEAAPAPGAAPAGRPRLRGRVAVAVALTVALLVPMTALGGFGAGSKAVQSAVSSTKSSVSKLVSKSKKSKRAAHKKSKAAKPSTKRYLAQVTVDVYGGDDSNWPYHDGNGDPLTQNIYKLYLCHQKGNGSWKVVGLKYGKWVNNVANHSSHLNDKGYYQVPPTPAQCASLPS